SKDSGLFFCTDIFHHEGTKVYEGHETTALGRGLVRPTEKDMPVDERLTSDCTLHGSFAKICAKRPSVELQADLTSMTPQAINAVPILCHLNRRGPQFLFVNVEMSLLVDELKKPIV